MTSEMIQGAVALRNSCDYVTVLTMDAPTGKLYSVGSDGRIVKTPAANNANGWAVTHHVPDVEAMVRINEQVSGDINKAIVLGYIRETEDGQPYRLMSVKNFDEFARVNEIKVDKFNSKPIEHDALRYATRTKRMFHASTWVMFDRDTVDGMPEELKPDATFDEWMAMMRLCFPEIIGVDYVAIDSASSRVVLNGTPVAAQNTHVYMQIKEALDSERFGKAALIQSFARGYGFLRPTISSTTGQQIGNRMWTLFDPTTFSRERLCFDGSPIVDPNTIEVALGNLKVEPSKPILYKGSARRLNTRALLTPTKEQQRALDLEISINKGGRVTSTNMLDLTPDILLEYHDRLTGIKGQMTMAQFVEGNVDRLSCQAVFRPDSSSWAAYVSKEDGCQPFMHDVATHVNYMYNDVTSAFQKIIDQKDAEATVVDAVDVVASVPLPPSAELLVPAPPITTEREVVSLANTFYGGLHNIAPEFAESDLANAQRYVGAYRSIMRYVPMAKSWYEWLGHRWKQCEGQVELARGQALSNAMCNEAGERPDDDSYRKWAKASCSTSSVRNMIAAASVIPAMVVGVDRIDQNWYQFGVGNGYIDLRLDNQENYDGGNGNGSIYDGSGQCDSTGGGNTYTGCDGGIVDGQEGGSRLKGFNPPDREVFITKGTEVSYVAGARCPEWETAVWEILSHDRELVDFFQRLVGYTMMGLPKEEITAFLVGEGSNGKSTLTGVLEAVFGEYKSTVNKALLMTSHMSNGESPTPSLARLKGIRMAVVTETKEGDVLDESAIKSLSGSDTVTARNLNSAPFEFKPMFVTWIATNHPPIIKSDDFGTWRRIVEIPFKRNFMKELGADKLDKHLSDRIINNELSGVLLWAMEGARQYQLNGLMLPDKVKHATEGYRQSMDVLSDWLEDCCELGDEFEATHRDLWQSYEKFTQSTSDQLIKSGRMLAKKLSSGGFGKVRYANTTRDRGFKGLRLRFGG